MIVLSVEQVLKLHEMMLQSTGGAEGVRDRGALKSAIYHAFASFYWIMPFENFRF